MDDRRTRALYTVNEGGYSKVFGLDAKTWKPLEMPKLPPADQTFYGSTTALRLAALGPRVRALGTVVERVCREKIATLAEQGTPQEWMKELSRESRSDGSSTNIGA